MTDERSAEAQVSRDQQSPNLVVPAAREPLPLPAAAGNEGQGSRDSPAPPALPTSPADTQARIQFAEATHQYIRDNIRLADQKATFFFTGATALLAFLYRINLSNRWLKPLMLWNIIDTFAFVAMIALGVGAFAALLVVIPRTPGSRRGFIFWEAIAEYDTGRQYADDLLVLSPASLFQVKAEHCFDLAVVCRRKYKFMRCALWICAVGLAASLVVFLTSASGRPASDELTASPPAVVP